jgi:hypothetical protein
MPIDIPLPGLDRLIAVCQRHSLPVQLYHPLPSAPPQDELLFGEPFDPQLATVHHRFGGAELGRLALLRFGSEWNNLIPWNKSLREDDAIQFHSSLIFARETGFAFYYATVPRLANSQGIQPVVYIQAMEAPTSVPVASSVDRFFDTYSRYFELMVVDPEYIHHRIPEVSFPWSVPHLISRDELLMDQVRAGHFDFLAKDDPSALEWLQQLREHTT